jgi:hypothetical protein
MSTRRAATLVEMVMTMSAGTSLILLAIGLMHQTLTLSRQASGRADAQRSLARLAMLFRDDVHRARAVAVENDDQLNLELADEGRVLYRFVDHRLTREYQRASGKVEHERFAFDAGHSATFQSLREPTRAGLIIRHDPGLYKVPAKTELHVEAVLNRWQWAENGREEQGP